MRKGRSEVLTPQQLEELGALAALPDDAIDTRDIPEQTDWSGAKRGVFFRPAKERLTLSLDADVVAWFKNHASGESLQASVNSALREHVQRESGTTSRRR